MTYKTRALRNRFGVNFNLAIHWWNSGRWWLNGEPWKTCHRFDNMKPKCYGNIVIYELVVVCFALCPGTETVTGRSLRDVKQLATAAIRDESIWSFRGLRSSATDTHVHGFYIRLPQKLHRLKQKQIFCTRCCFWRSESFVKAVAITGQIFPSTNNKHECNCYKSNIHLMRRTVLFIHWVIFNDFVMALISMRTFNFG